MGAARFGGALVFPGVSRFREGWMGRSFNYPNSGGNPSDIIEVNGVLETTVVQTGRLVSGSESALESRIDTLRGLAEAQTVGTLESGGTRVWTGITMLRVRFDDRVDVGRQWSVGYTVDYAVLA